MIVTKNNLYWSKVEDIARNTLTIKQERVVEFFENIKSRILNVKKLP
jgi:hypothetical protein